MGVMYHLKSSMIHHDSLIKLTKFYSIYIYIGTKCTNNNREISNINVKFSNGWKQRVEWQIFQLWRQVFFKRSLIFLFIKFFKLIILIDFFGLLQVLRSNGSLPFSKGVFNRNQWIFKIYHFLKANLFLVHLIRMNSFVHFFF